MKCKALIRSIIKMFTSNERVDVFRVFHVAAATESVFKIPNWLNDSSSCVLSNQQVDARCFPHEVNSERAAVRRISTILKGSICPRRKELGQLVPHCIYASVMYMVVFGPKISAAQRFSKISYISFMT